MSDIFPRILNLVSRGDTVVSDHGYEELAADGILIKDIYARVGEGIVVEEYP